MQRDESAKPVKTTPGLAGPAGPADYSTVDYMTVVHIYQKVLDRSPTREEFDAALAHFANGISSVDIEKTLMHTDEYRRMIAMQSNLVLDEFEGLYTDQHLRAYVINRYHELVGDLPDGATVDFLHDKFRRRFQDVHALDALIRSISIAPLAGTRVGARPDDRPAP